MSEQEKEESLQMEEFQQDFALLIELGFIGAKQLDEMSATRIFHACQVIIPSSVAPQIGMGHIALSKLETKKATTIFEKIIETEPGNELAQCFLGVCYLLSKDKEKLKKGEKILKDTSEATTDETVKNLTVLCLEWSKKDLSKKTQSPFAI